jgi:hypothetical protein
MIIAISLVGCKKLAPAKTNGDEAPVVKFEPKDPGFALKPQDDQASIRLLDTGGRLKSLSQEEFLQSSSLPFAAYFAPLGKDSSRLDTGVRVRSNCVNDWRDLPLKVKNSWAYAAGSYELFCEGEDRPSSRVTYKYWFTCIGKDMEKVAGEKLSTLSAILKSCKDSYRVESRVDEMKSSYTTTTILIYEEGKSEEYGAVNLTNQHMLSFEAGEQNIFREIKLENAIVSDDDRAHYLDGSGQFTFNNWTGTVDFLGGTWEASSGSAPVMGAIR